MNAVDALTIHQPYVEAILQGFKTHETRSWYTGKRGRIALHAGKVRPSRATILRTGMPEIEYPLGFVVGYAFLEDCLLMTPELITAQTEQERDLGYWKEGRFALKLSHVERLSIPIPCRGQLGFWKFYHPTNR